MNTLIVPKAWATNHNDGHTSFYGTDFVAVDRGGRIEMYFRSLQALRALTLEDLKQFRRLTGAPPDVLDNLIAASTRERQMVPSGILIFIIDRQTGRIVDRWGPPKETWTALVDRIRQEGDA